MKIVETSVEIFANVNTNTNSFKVTNKGVVYKSYVGLWFKVLESTENTDDYNMIKNEGLRAIVLELKFHNK